MGSFCFNCIVNLSQQTPELIWRSILFVAMGVMRSYETFKEVVYMVPHLKYPAMILTTENTMTFCSFLYVWILVYFEQKKTSRQNTIIDVLELVDKNFKI